MHLVEVTNIHLVLSSFWLTWLSTLLSSHICLSVPEQKLQQGYLKTSVTSSIEKKKKWVFDKKKEPLLLENNNGDLHAERTSHVQQKAPTNTFSTSEPLSLNSRLKRSSISNSAVQSLWAIYLLKFNSKKITLQKWSHGDFVRIFSNEKPHLLNS